MTTPTYLRVKEIAPGQCTGCVALGKEAGNRRDNKLCKQLDPYDLPGEQGCSERHTIFIYPDKVPEYLALRLKAS